MTDILDDLAQYEAEPPAPLVLDVSGRLHCGRTVLPMAPAALPRTGYITRGGEWHFSDLDRGVRAEVVWRETVMQAHERQGGRGA